VGNLGRHKHPFEISTLANLEPLPSLFPSLAREKAVEYGLIQTAPIWQEKVAEWQDVLYPSPYVKRT